MARRKTAPTGPDTDPTLPPELAIGPCIEVWGDLDRDPTDYETETSTWPAWRARRNWHDAIEHWAIESGWAGTDRDHLLCNAPNLARIRHPWSRQFLLARGETDFVDYLEGRRPDHPGRPGAGWQPLCAG